MGISRLKRLLSDDISRTFNTRDLQFFVREIDNSLDLYKLTGFPPNCVIPRQDAAKAVVDYIFQAKKSIKLLDLVINTHKNGFRGEKIVFNGIQEIVKEMADCGYKYNKELNKVIVVEKSQDKRNDWGFLKKIKIIISVCICGYLWQP